MRIGELVRDVEKTLPGPGPEDTSGQPDATPKAQAIADAGQIKNELTK